MRKLNILLVGVGGYGGNYIRELTDRKLDSVRIVGICDVLPNLETLYPVIKEEEIPVFASPEDFYKKRGADLAIISTPIHLHFSHVQACLKGGSDVLIEKPVCTSLEEAADLMELERKSGRFVAVGYQLNYSRDVLQLKRDIMGGRFGKPLAMKTLHCLRRGEQYYHRNGWAGHINVNGCMVNDSPFNNACAHQFQNSTFLLGESMDTAQGIADVQAELYRANREVENFDTACIRAVTESGVKICYYTTHALRESKIGPRCEYRFEHAVIYYGKDFGNGPVMDYVSVLEDGTAVSYGTVCKGERLQKMYDAIACSEARLKICSDSLLPCPGAEKRPFCGITCAIPHLDAVTRIAGLPVRQLEEKDLEHEQSEDDSFTYIKNLKKSFTECFENEKLPSELGYLK